MGRQPVRIWFWTFALSGLLRAQSTDGVMAGRIYDAVTEHAIAGAKVTCQGPDGESAIAFTNLSGFYLLSLSPGTYRVRFEARGYQPRTAFQSRVFVSGRLDLDAGLRGDADVYDQGVYANSFLIGTDAIVHVYAADVATTRAAPVRAFQWKSGALVASVSDVVMPEELRVVPFPGRDSYTMIVAQRGVNSDTGAARGLGVYANGQRASASNFLLDGVDFNNRLITGPLLAPPPEAIREYRVSINNYSAEYGGTSGYLANVVTRAGGDAWHGILYGYAKHERLNANAFQNNLAGAGRPKTRELQAGLFAGGPLGRSLRLSGAYERLDSSSRAPVGEIIVPSAGFLEAARLLPQPNPALALLTRYPPPPARANPRALEGIAEVANPVNVRRSFANVRLGGTVGSHQVFLRATWTSFGRPDFIWTPYPDFVSSLREPAWNHMAAAQGPVTAAWRYDVRVSMSFGRIEWNRPNRKIPTLNVATGMLRWDLPVVLPGSPAMYDFRHDSLGSEALATLFWSRGRHIVKFGGGVLWRWLSGAQTVGRDGRYLFPTMADFEQARSFSPMPPIRAQMALSREALETSLLALPSYHRDYRQSEFRLYFQDDLRLTPRLCLNFGVRYERFGALVNTGSVKDALLELGPGTGFPAKIATARIVYPQSGDQPLYNPGGGNWAGRFGVAWNPDGESWFIVRAAYGLFFDRPFDNLLLNVRNNNVYLSPPLALSGKVDFLQPLDSLLQNVRGQLLRDRPQSQLSLTYIEPNLRAGYSQNFFAGVQTRITNTWSAEANFLGSVGRRLVTTDLLNRDFSLPDGDRYNPSLPEISYRANQGVSDYRALAAAVTYGPGRHFFQLAYTLSRAIDLQSEPLLPGDFSTLLFANARQAVAQQDVAGFTEQLNSRRDRGHADFDQRHNVVFFSHWELPYRHHGRFTDPLLRGWSVSQTAAVRSGFPFTVTVPITTSEGALLANRADLSHPELLHRGYPADRPGGQAWLNPDAFTAPPSGRVGNTARNQFYGPGFYNFDVSIARTIVASERARLTFRTDIFNLFNHANLGRPDAHLDPARTDRFAYAPYGRSGRESAFPALLPLSETPRQILLMLRLEF